MKTAVGWKCRNETPVWFLEDPSQRDLLLGWQCLLSLAGWRALAPPARVEACPNTSFAGCHFRCLNQMLHGGRCYSCEQKLMVSAHKEAAISLCGMLGELFLNHPLNCPAGRSLMWPHWVVLPSSFCCWYTSLLTSRECGQGLHFSSLVSALDTKIWSQVRKEREGGCSCLRFPPLNMQWQCNFFYW